MQLLLQPSRGLRFREGIVKMSDLFDGNHVIKISFDVKRYVVFDLSILQHLMKHFVLVLLSPRAVSHLQEITLPVHFTVSFTKEATVHIA
jgi:hypothetical protein